VKKKNSISRFPSTWRWLCLFIY